MALLRFEKAPEATAPSIAAPRSTGSGVLTDAQQIDHHLHQPVVVADDIGRRHLDTGAQLRAASRKYLLNRGRGIPDHRSQIDRAERDYPLAIGDPGQVDQLRLHRDGQS